MNRYFTVFCVLAAVGSGMFVYTEKHHTALLDRNISKVIRATEAARERTGLLRAEWALLNEPERLQDMSDKYLQLKPMAPTQFVQLSDLSTRLPAPVAATPPGADVAPIPDGAAPAPQTVGDTPVAAVDASSATPKIAVVVPKATASRPLTKLAHAEMHTRPSHHIAVADRALGHQGPMMHGTPLPLASPQPLGAHVYSAMARPMRPMRLPGGRTPIISAVPHYATSTGYVASSLGGRDILPPPVPLQ